jgi:hypothetical protein
MRNTLILTTLLFVTGLCPAGQADGPKRSESAASAHRKTDTPVRVILVQVPARTVAPHLRSAPTRARRNNVPHAGTGHSTAAEGTTQPVTLWRAGRPASQV